jgi:hypothetical protein
MSKRPKKAEWEWKTAGAAAKTRPGMLYEPGNWGDVLKGTWAVALAGALARAKRPGPLSYLDPYAGAPSYPLTKGARERLLQLTGSELATLQAPLARRGLWASTALLVRAACGAVGCGVEPRVYDLDPERRAAWREVPGVDLLPVRAAAEALESARAAQAAPDLVLLDPYDFLAEWKDLLPHALVLAERSAVLAYVYNRAPRSTGYWNDYRRFREALTSGRTRGGYLLGRIPSDAVLPRAYHEVFLLGGREALDAVREALRGATRALARGLAEAGAFEEQT